MNVATAAEYAERYALHALVITRGADVVFERYGPDHGPSVPHALYSGTKSFWGVLAVAAQEDGLLSLDEPVSQTIPQWKDDTRKARVTLRQLLALTSGIGFGGLGSAVPMYARALDSDIKNEPGEVFTYGGIPLQVFGAVLDRKLAARKLTPHAYLQERILGRIGLRVATWRKLKDGTHPLSTGAAVAPLEWLKFGRLIVDRGRHAGRTVVVEAALATCFAGSSSNARYGLGWWLRPLGAPSDIVYASGSGGQGLYVIPSLDTVIVHFGGSASFRHESFLRRLLPQTDRAQRKTALR